MQPLQLIPSVYISTAELPHLDDDLQPAQDPVALVRGWCAAGVTDVQILDVDTNIASPHGLQTVAQARHVGARPWAWGGVEEPAYVQALMSAGAHQVVLPIAAWRKWGRTMIEQFPGRLILGLDVLGDHVAQHDDREMSASVNDVAELLDEWRVPRVIVRCLASDGRLTGPNYELLGRMCARTSAAVIVSGGIATLEDLRRLRGLVPIGVEGAVVGRALSAGVFSVAQAREVTSGVVPLGPSIQGAK